MVTKVFHKEEEVKKNQEEPSLKYILEKSHIEKINKYNKTG